jgi:hypothetical protein
MHQRIGRNPSIKADFEAACRALPAKRTEADFPEWRDERDGTAK